MEGPCSPCAPYRPSSLRCHGVHLNSTLLFFHLGGDVVHLDSTPPHPSRGFHHYSFIEIDRRTPKQSLVDFSLPHCVFDRHYVSELFVMGGAGEKDLLHTFPSSVVATKLRGYPMCPTVCLQLVTPFSTTFRLLRCTLIVRPPSPVSSKLGLSVFATSETVHHGLSYGSTHSNR